MIDETTPPGSQDTAGTDGPPDTGTQADAPTFDESQYVPITRYTEAQAWGTKASQEAAELRQKHETAEQTAYAWQVYATTDDPDLKRQAAEALGLETEQPVEDDDPLSTLNARVEKFEKWQEEQTRQATEAAENERIGTLIGERITALVNESGQEYSEAEMKVLYGLALLEQDEKGDPNPQAAWDLFHEVGKTRSKQILSGKRDVHKPSSGVDASKRPDMSTRKGRLEFAEERLAALESDGPL